MRLSLPRRLVAALFALWLAILIAEPALVHACPMHDRAPAAATTSGHDAHETHGAAASMPAADDAAPADAPHAHCMCLGACSPTGPAAVLPAPAATFAALETRLPEPGLPDHAYVPVARALVLPFANGPPATGTDAPVA